MADKFGWQKANRRDAARRGAVPYRSTRPKRRTDRMPFGKYKGRPFSSIPHDYLRWVLREVPNLHGLTRMAIEGVLHTASV